ncbi:MAG: alanine--tRNA ligase [Patescibacteria group bacterium]
MVTVSEVREKYINFFVGKNHKIIPPAPIVPKDDPTTLFTSSGMQALVPYLMGKPHPLGKRLVNSQPVIRLGDIDLVGDFGHLTFFEMLGNWSLGDYFKKEQLAYFYEFLTKELGFEKERLFVTYFEGSRFIPKDEETILTWKKLGVKDDHIYGYSVEKNWWSRCGTPDEMSVGEIGGTDSEVFYDFGSSHNVAFGEKCHPNCDCGRFLEIGNSVFMEYIKKEDGTFEKLPQKNVDFGGGLERLTSAVNNTPDIFEIDVFQKIIQEIEKFSKKSYSDKSFAPAIRVMADHIRAAEFLISAGVVPSNKDQGYILRRLIRRFAVKMAGLTGSTSSLELLRKSSFVSNSVCEELKKFSLALDKGLKVLEKMVKETPSGNIFSGEKAFLLYESYGFPVEVTDELVRSRGFGKGVDTKEFLAQKECHIEASRKLSKGLFKSGLADKSEETKKLHTATHLLHSALRKVLGEDIAQKGSNVTAERLRFDFSYTRRLTDEEISKVEDMVNEIISKGLIVQCKEMSLKDAQESGALAFFGEKYSDRVTVYEMGDFSKELCAGPHAENTNELGIFKIIKQESVGSNTRRIKAILQ